MLESEIFYFSRYHFFACYSKPAGEVDEDEGPFLPRPSGPAPSYYRYGAPAEYGRPGPPPVVHDDFMP
jgi:hypothetical protein